MSDFVQATLGRCGFLDVLEEAAIRHYRVTLGLTDGAEISGTVLDVVTADGADWVVLDGHSRVETGSIVWLKRVPSDPASHPERHRNTLE